MQQFILIGYPKTATSWFKNRYFPFIKNVEFIPSHIFNEHIITPNAYIFDPKEAKDYFHQNYTNDIIVGSHIIVGTNHHFDLNGYLSKEHANRLKAVFPDARIMLFIRSQPDIIASAYSQYIRGGGTHSVDRYLNKPYIKHLSNLSLFSYTFYEYDKIIEYYYKLFSKEKVHVFLYEDFKRNSKLFCQNLKETFHFDIDIDKINFEYLNRKLRITLFYVTRFLNMFSRGPILNKYYIFHVPFWFSRYRKMMNVLNNYSFFGSIPTSKRILGRKNYRKIMEYYKSSNARLIKEFGLHEIRKYNYPL